jgi:hypothetical protein
MIGLKRYSTDPVQQQIHDEARKPTGLGDHGFILTLGLIAKGDLKAASLGHVGYFVRLDVSIFSFGQSTMH